jgi:hypothetical protein
MRELWLKARDEEIIIECDSKAAAVLIRFQLYNAVKVVREAPESNPELAAAVEIVQISLRGEGQNVLRIGRSEAAEKLDSIFNQLGITGVKGKVKDALDIAAEESLKKLQQTLGEAQELAAAPTSGRVTPYYTREA